MLQRAARALAWRICWPTEILVFRAASLAQPPAAPSGFTLLELDGKPGDLEVAEAAMAAAGEPAGLACPRFRNGDQFFAWRSESQVVSFGWVTGAPRVIGRTVMPAVAGRGYLYHFFTLREFREQGLYSRLLLAMRHALTAGGKHDLIIDVNARNTASLRGVRRAGFSPAGKTSYLSVFRHWNIPLASITLEPNRPIVM